MASLVCRAVICPLSIIPHKLRILLALLHAFAALPAVAAADRAVPHEPVRIVIGKVNHNPGKHLARLGKMAEFLQARLSERYLVEVRVVSSLTEMIRLVREGDVNIVSETPFAALALEDKAHAEILLGEMKKGARQYGSIFIKQRGEASLKTLKDLKGRVIAFEDPGSTSGFLLPLAAMRASGLICQELKHFGDPVPEGSVGYVFANHEINITTWVSYGQVDAGALSNLDWNDSEAVPLGLRDGLEIFHREKDILRSVLLVSRGLDAEVRQLLDSVLPAMHDKVAGRKILKKYNKLERFFRLDQSDREQLQVLKKSYALVRDELK